ncbi:MAG: hypothetical protein ACRC4M_02825 [Mycoplasma sp.]
MSKDKVKSVGLVKWAKRAGFGGILPLVLGAVGVGITTNAIGDFQIENPADKNDPFKWKIGIGKNNWLRTYDVKTGKPNSTDEVYKNELKEEVNKYGSKNLLLEHIKSEATALNPNEDLVEFIKIYDVIWMVALIALILGSVLEATTIGLVVTNLVKKPKKDVVA